MPTVTMRYGDETLAFAVEGAGSLTTLAPKPAPALADMAAAFAHAVTDGAVASPPLDALLCARDKVTIVVSDITRYWMRQDLLCGLLVDFLHEKVGIACDGIEILVALGTHRAQTEAECRRIVSPGVYERVRVHNHDCDARDLVDVGVTSRGTCVRVHPLAVGRKLILTGGTVHHLMSGFGGGRKSILPGICARETIYQNHLHALDASAPRSSPGIGMGVLAGNPLHEDMVEAAALVAPAFGINAVVGEGGHIALCCGHWLHAWEESCRIVHDTFGVPIAQRADVVVASCGGFPRDIELYQGTKSLMNAVQAVRPGGTLLFLAQCREGGGPPAFFGWLDSLRRGTLDADLRARFDVAGYIFYALCEAMQSISTCMLTEIAPTTLAQMGIMAAGSLDALLPCVDFAGKDVILMPFAGATMPYLAQK